MARKSSKKDKSANSTTKEVVNAKTVKDVKKKGEESDAPTTGIYGWVLKLLAVVAAVAVTYWLRELDKMDFDFFRGGYYISRSDVNEYLRFNITCAPMKESDLFVPGCHLENGTMCGRVLMDNFVTSMQVKQLRQIADIGMKNRSTLGGPTIMDINTGFVRDSESLVNIYQPEERIPNEDLPGIKRFDKKQFNLYRSIVEKVRRAVMKEFGLKDLYFTAPTFMTRFIGNESWMPVEIHDEYWHPHVDKTNTRHYDYSSLLYLSDFDQEFTGGLFSFIDEGKETIVEPARGRLLMFTAGSENLHVVRKVKTGSRYALSLWFTCDESKQFENFLDGVMHKHFRRT